jgi:hypothetical protein
LIADLGGQPKQVRDHLIIIKGSTMPIEGYECILSGKLAGQFVQSILHVRVDNSSAQPPFNVADHICQEFNTSSQLVENWLGVLPADYFLTSMRVRRVSPTGGPTQIYLAGNLVGTQGTRAGTVDVSSVCPLIIWLTTANPSKTGRTFVPGVSDGDIDEMVLDGTLLSSLDVLGDYWVAGGTLPTSTLVWTGGIFRRGSNSIDAITNFRVSPIIGQQRRRQQPI